MAKKEPPPDPRAFNPIRDAFWAKKYPTNPNYDHKDWADNDKKPKLEGGGNGS